MQSDGAYQWPMRNVKTDALPEGAKVPLLAQPRRSGECFRTSLATMPAYFGTASRKPWQQAILRRRRLRKLRSTVICASLCPMTQKTPSGTLLDDIESFLRDCLYSQPDQHLTIALWAIHTHALEAFEFTPYLGLTSKRAGSGKTQVFRAVELLVANPLPISAFSDSSVFRDAATDPPPTLLIDELDNVFSKNNPRRELRAILNSGNERRGSVRRTVKGEDGSFTTEGYRQFSAKAFAGIGTFPPALRDRCIMIEMEAPPADAGYERFRRRTRPAIEARAEQLKQRVESWAKQNIERLIEAEPYVPAVLHGRKEDLWEPLFAIADALNEEVKKGRTDFDVRARSAAIALSASGSQDREFLGLRALYDARRVLLEGEDTIRSNVLAEDLANLGSPWDNYYENGPISSSALAELLRPLGIKPFKLNYYHQGKRKNASFYREVDFDRVLAEKAKDGFFTSSLLHPEAHARPVKAVPKQRPHKL